MIDSGSCGSNGYKMLESKIECEQAAADLGLYDKIAIEDQSDGRPHGCIYAALTAWFRLLWNSPETQYPSEACGSDAGYNCICLKGKYSNNNRF